jgi:hypothetical protein
MSLSDLEQHVFAYFAANGAQDMKMDPKFAPYGELALIFEDRIQLAVRKFGVKAEMASRNVSRVFLDILLEKGAFSTAKNSLGEMHRFEGKVYPDCIKGLQETNPIIQKAKAGGSTFWDDTFTALKRNP